MKSFAPRSTISVLKNKIVYDIIVATGGVTMSYYNYNRNIRNRLKAFCRNNLTVEQAQSLFILFVDNKELFSRLCQAYNEYKVSCGREYLCVITNLDALFKTPEAEEKFIKEIKEYIMDVIGIKRGDVENGTIKDNSAK